MTRHVLALAATALFVSGTALGSPVTVDGDIGVSEYGVSVDDALNEAGLDSASLDIETMYFDEDQTADFYYVGLEVLSEPIDRDGGSTTMLDMTMLILRLYDTTGTSLKYTIRADLWAAGGALLVWDSTNTPVVLGAGDYELAGDDGSSINDLELGIKRSVLSDLNGVDSPYFRAQLDDTGFASDDQLAGNIPEPATLALVSLGGLALLRRRRA